MEQDWTQHTYATLVSSNFALARLHIVLNVLYFGTLIIRYYFQLFGETNLKFYTLHFFKLQEK
jgi:hypothetical protein